MISPAPYAAGAVNGGSPGVRVALHEAGLSKLWHEAWAKNDDRAVGELLGFPKCCREFFLRAWKGGSADPTATMTGASELGPAEVNPLLRWAGVRLVPHMPCSFQCVGSLELARAIAFVAEGNGLGPLLRDVLALLGAPTTWTALHGAGEVTVEDTLRVAFSTEYTAALREIRRHGTPLDMTAPDPTTWEDCGFKTEQGMRDAHDVVECHAAKVIGMPDAPPTVLDLGCGDGALLDRMKHRFQGACTTIGVEVDPGRVARGRERHPGIGLHCGRIEALADDAQTDQVDLVLLMPGRLLEMPEGVAEKVRDTVRRIAKHLVIYTYDGVDLAELAQRAGLRVVGEIVKSGATSVAEGR
jgi:hypothetical protein